MCIEYKSGSELKFAEALSRLYCCRAVGEDSVDPDWPMLVMRNKDAGFLAGTSEATRAKVLNHKDKFSNAHDTLHRKLADGNTSAYLPTSQRVNTILSYHRDLGHT